MTNDWVEIEILNWDKYNPRTDRKKHTWFRVQNNIATEPKFHGLNPAQWKAAVCLFAEASKSGSACVKVSVSWFAHLLHIRAADVRASIQQLTDNGVVAVTSRLPTGYRPGTSGVPTDGRTLRTDVTDGQTRSAEPRIEFNFNTLYLRYPRKIGKAEGLKRCEREVKTPEEFELLATAIDRFVAHHREKGTEEKFIPYFSTFMTSWRDWAEAEAGSAQSFAGSEGIDWSKLKPSGVAS